MASIFIGLPCYGGQVFTHCMRGIMQLTHLLRDQGHDFALSTTVGESLIPRGRNTLVHNFLKTQCTHLFFIDADIQFNPRDVLGMLEAGKPLVGGAYPKKTINQDQVRAAALRGEADIMRFAADFVVNIDRDMGIEPDVDGNVEVKPDKGCVPVLEVGTGFLLIERQVFIDMARAYPETMHQSDAKDTYGEVVHAWFDCQIVDGRYLSEDYLFCRRWRAMGGKTWLYLPAKLEHVGQWVFSGDLSTVFRPTAQLHQASEWSDIPALDDKDPQKAWHLFRYGWAAERIRARKVANAACGAGYGNPMLLTHAESVCGFDRNEQALAIGKEKYAGEGSWFAEACDIESKTFEGFDTLVSLETFEHLKDPVGWLGRLSSDVKELVLSAPVIPTKHQNPYHLHDFTAQELLNVLRASGWEVLETAHQAEWQPNAVLLVHARRRITMAAAA